jgi:hypothetical protein
MEWALHRARREQGARDERVTGSFLLDLIILCQLQGAPLLSSGKSSWLQIQRSGFDSRRYHILWEVVGLERGPLSLVSTTEELFWGNSSGSNLENGEYGRRDPPRCTHNIFYSQKLALTSPTSGGRSVRTVLSRTKATELLLLLLLLICQLEYRCEVS